MYYIYGFITLNIADFYYVCGSLRLWTLLHWRALHTAADTSVFFIRWQQTCWGCCCLEREAKDVAYSAQ